MIFNWGFHYFLHSSSNFLDPTDLQIASTSSAPVDQKVVLSQGAKRKFTATRKRQTRRRIVPDKEDGSEFYMKDAEGQTIVQNAPDGSEFNIKDAEGQTIVQNAWDDHKFHMKDAHGQTVIHKIQMVTSSTNSEKRQIWSEMM